MRLQLAVLSACIAVAAAAGSAVHAAASPSVVPIGVQRLLAQRASALAYVPTRLPLGYAYRSVGIRPARGSVTLVFVRTPRRATQPPIRVTIARREASLASCGRGALRTLQLAGNRVYWDGRTAWRCTRAPAGKRLTLRVTGAADPAVFATAFAYGRVAASIARVHRPVGANGG